MNAYETAAQSCIAPDIEIEPAEAVFHMFRISVDYHLAKASAAKVPASSYYTERLNKARARAAKLGAANMDQYDALVDAWKRGKEAAMVPAPAWNMQDGTRVLVSELRGYVLHQNRPFSPFGAYGPGMGRMTGEPYDGRTFWYLGTIARHISWMDNSDEIEVLCDDGHFVRVMVNAPHGDVCY